MSAGFDFEQGQENKAGLDEYRGIDDEAHGWGQCHMKLAQKHVQAETADWKADTV